MARFGSNYVFKNASDLPYESFEKATLKGVGLKTILLLLITIIAGVISLSFMKIGSITGGMVIFGYALSPILVLILSLIMSFRPNTARVLAVPYAIAEGLGIGSIAAILIQGFGLTEAGVLLGLALLITVAIFLGGTVLYTSGLIKVTGTLRKIMFLILLGSVLFSLIFLIISFFSPSIYAIFFGNGNLSLVLSVIMVIVSSIYTVISLDNANKIVQSGLDKNYEWYASFGIVLNIVWLFYEVLRLLLIIFSRSKD
ncbi:MAG: Bax inhibitor-1/YccA family protein [Bacilli bacterium]|nr:Bax inhibitor-1/YccA family protein [Bacilli bacterium]